MPFYKDSMGNGNLHINFKVNFPARGELSVENIKQLKTVRK